MDLQASVDRAERELVRLGEHGLDTQTWFYAANALLSRAVGFGGSCWQTNDPATALITSHLTLNLPSGFPRWPPTSTWPRTSTGSPTWPPALTRSGC